MEELSKPILSLCPYCGEENCCISEHWLKIVLKGLRNLRMKRIVSKSEKESHYFKYFINTIITLTLEEKQTRKLL